MWSGKTLKIDLRQLIHIKSHLWHVLNSKGWASLKLIITQRWKMSYLICTLVPVWMVRHIYDCQRPWNGHFHPKFRENNIGTAFFTSRTVFQAWTRFLRWFSTCEQWESRLKLRHLKKYWETLLKNPKPKTTHSFGDSNIMWCIRQNCTMSWLIP